MDSDPVAPGKRDPEVSPQIEEIILHAMERDFNKRAGFTAQQDRLPRFMTIEPLAPHNVTFPVKDEDLDKVFN